MFHENVNPLNSGEMKPKYRIVRNLNLPNQVIDELIISLKNKYTGKLLDLNSGSVTQASLFNDETCNETHFMESEYSEDTFSTQEKFLFIRFWFC